MCRYSMNTTQKTITTVHLFASGKDINEADLFIATINHVEGRRRVTLTKVDN